MVMFIIMAHNELKKYMCNDIIKITQSFLLPKKTRNKLFLCGLIAHFAEEQHSNIVFNCWMKNNNDLDDINYLNNVPPVKFSHFDKIRFIEPHDYWNKYPQHSVNYKIIKIIRKYKRNRTTLDNFKHTFNKFARHVIL